MALVLKGVRDRISVPCTARFLIDGGEVFEHRFNASFRRLKKADRRALSERLRHLRDEIKPELSPNSVDERPVKLSSEHWEKPGTETKPAQHNAFDLIDRLDTFKEQTLREFMTGWDLGDEEGDPIIFLPDHVAEVLQHREYLDALWVGFETVQGGYQRLAAKNS
jgi:hypothetical protein